MKFGSLFTGIGGFDLAFEQAGMTCAWQCEINAAARSVLARHWPNVPIIEDVKNVGRDVAAVDLVCGGFPCQDLSIAGPRTGLAGERSGLWYEFERVLGDLRPQWVVIENVPGLLSSHRGRDFAIVLQGLVKCGYGVAWRVLDAQYFGVAQRRRRVFIVGRLGDGRSAQVLFEREGLFGHPPARRTQGESLTPSVANGINNSGLRGRQPGSAASFVSAPLVFDWQSGGDVRHNISSLHTSALQANQTPAVAFVQNTSDEVRQIGGDGQLVIAATSQSGGNGNRPSSRGEHLVVEPLSLQPLNGIISSKGNDNYANAKETRPDKVLRVLPEEAGEEEVQDRGITEYAALQTPEVLRQDLYGSGFRRKADEGKPRLDDGALSRTKDDGEREMRDMREAGTSGRTSQERELQGQQPGQPSGALPGMSHARTPETEGLQGVRGETQRARILRKTPDDVARGPLAAGVRRLTPTECCRLQGFPDDWNAHGIDDQGNPVFLSDSARYRQLGNAVAVPVARWIGERIASL